MTQDASCDAAGKIEIANLDVELNLVEMFSSVQGEGTSVGASTLFVRFGECDLRCRWCDSPNTWKRAGKCRVETARGRATFRNEPNPLTVRDVMRYADALELDRHEFVSLTGGEPLLQPEAVRELSIALRERASRVLLETHGAAPASLERVVDVIDVVSMDWKLASDVRRVSDPRSGPIEAFHEVHQRFLQIAARAPEVVVKVVVSTRTSDEEVDEMVSRIADTAPAAALIVQPMTPFGAARDAPTAERLLALCARIAHRLPQVRLIPQTHKSYGAL